MKMEPIQLTKYGECLGEGELGSIINADGEKLLPLENVGSPGVGVHEVCGGLIELMAISVTHNALLCDKCGLRVVIPNNIKTRNQLREHMKRELASQAADIIP